MDKTTKVLILLALSAIIIACVFISIDRRLDKLEQYQQFFTEHVQILSRMIVEQEEFMLGASEFDYSQQLRGDIDKHIAKWGEQ